MARTLAGLAAASVLLVSLYACSGDEGGSTAPANDPDGGSTGSAAMLGSDGAAGSDSATTRDGSSGEGGSSHADAAIDAATDASADATVDAGPPPTPVVRFIGRFDTTPASGPKVGFPGASIFAQFSGTEVKATFADEVVYTDYGANRWQILIDGVATTVLTLNRAQTTFTLATGLPAGTHTVEVVKLTEAEVGISQFMGFDFSGGTLLAPPAAKTRHLEFLGDSASSGYGVDGTSSACPFTTATENERESYPALVAHDLNADHHNLSVAGKGLYWNYDRATDPEVFSILYPRTLPFTDGSSWSFADYTPDVVWMTLGGNDYDQPNPGDPPPPFASFQQKYDEMLVLVRTKHPSAHIFCAVAPSLSDNYPATPPYNAYTNVKNAASSVVAKYKALGDTKLYFFEFTRSTDADLTGCEGHPNVMKHRAMADEAIAQIKAKTLWP